METALLAKILISLLAAAFPGLLSEKTRARLAELLLQTLQKTWLSARAWGWVRAAGSKLKTVVVIVAVVVVVVAIAIPAGWGLYHFLSTDGLGRIARLVPQVDVRVSATALLGLVGVGLFLIRTFLRFQYGVAETVFALAVGWDALGVTKYGFAEFGKVVAALYLVVRGLDNSVEGVKKQFLVVPPAPLTAADNVQNRAVPGPAPSVVQ